MNSVDCRQLWLAFLGRYNDISLTIRIKCVQYTMHFLINHPEVYILESWLPDGYNQIFRLYEFGPSGLKDYGSAALQNLIPFFP